MTKKGKTRTQQEHTCDRSPPPGRRIPRHNRLGALEAGAGRGHRGGLQGRSGRPGSHGGSGDSGGHGGSGVSGGHGRSGDLGDLGGSTVALAGLATGICPPEKKTFSWGNLRSLGGALEELAMEGTQENRALEGALEAWALEGALEQRALEGALEERALEERALEEQTLEERALEERALEGNCEERALEGAYKERARGGHCRGAGSRAGLQHIPSVMPAGLTSLRMAAGMTSESIA